MITGTNSTLPTDLVVHTPGPWLIDERIAAPQRSSAIVAGELVIADTTRIWNYKANARLIAAAPDMLEALKFVRRIWAADDTCEEIRLIDAAIAKAEGSK